MGRENFNEMQRDLLEKMGLQFTEAEDTDGELEEKIVEDMIRQKEAQRKAEYDREKTEIATKLERAAQIEKNFPEIGSW